MTASLAVVQPQADLTAIERVMRRILKKTDIVLDTGCWEWRGAKTPTGYGLIQAGRRSEAGNRVPSYVHRVSYEAQYGAIPNGLVIDHLCRNPTCINPSHLEAVPQRTNMLRGESPTAITANSDQCRRGHLKSEVGVYRAPNGWNECRQCRTERRRAYWEAHGV